MRGCQRRMVQRLVLRKAGRGANARNDSFPIIGTDVVVGGLSVATQCVSGPINLLINPI